MNADELVNREVHYCVSSLVSTLAQQAWTLEHDHHDELFDLAQQAAELAAPVADYEAAARDAEAKLHKHDFDVDKYGPDAQRWIVLDQQENELWTRFFDTIDEAAQAYCDVHNIDPYDREVYEHWIVSDWLADKLIEKGEKVDKDFAGMTIWARTTTGQALCCDDVIRGIAECY